jgi:hypothetical protein
MAVHGWPAVARADWAGATLTDPARAKVQAISFFLLVMLACAAALRVVWNHLREDFPRLPALGFGKALGLVMLWGLLVIVVLTVVAAARELLPSDEKPEGPPPPPLGLPLAPAISDQEWEQRRYQKLERLGAALLSYARTHKGRFPDDPRDLGIDDEAWTTPDPSGMRYLYGAGRPGSGGRAVLAYEPDIFGRDVLVLRVDGTIERVARSDLRRELGPALEVPR